MKYIITKDDKYYLTYDSNNKHTITTNIENATTFSEERANSYINNCINPSERKHYSVMCLEDSVSESNELIYKQTDLDNEDYNFKDKCIDFSRFMMQLNQYKDNLIIKHREIEKKKTDLEHYIEFYTFNASQGYNAYRMLKDVMVERRKIKDNLLIVRALLSYNLEKLCDGSIIPVIKGLEERAYSPRILNELFVNDSSQESLKS